jgi:CRP-like cAMP-binding protein
MAHLLCELFLRFKAVGLANGNDFELPLTQAELADALGLSTVHVNRTIQELRGKNLIVLRGGSVTVSDWEALKAAGEFDPTYLHLQSREAA